MGRYRCTGRGSSLQGRCSVFDNSPKLTPVLGQVGYDTITRDGLLGEWLFDDNDTTGTIADTSGNGYHGTNVSGTFSEDTLLEVDTHWISSVATNQPG